MELFAAMRVSEKQLEDELIEKLEALKYVYRPDIQDRASLEQAMKGYRRLHKLGLKLLNPDGILASFCCSGLISMDMLESVIAQTAVDEKRDVQLLERRGQPLPIDRSRGGPRQPAAHAERLIRLV